MNKHLKCWAAAGLMALFMGTAAAAPQAMFQKSSIVAEAADTIKDYKIGKLIYTVNETKGTATVKGLNREYASNGIIDSVEIPATVTYKTGKKSSVIKIGDGAFKSDRYLKTVDMTNASELVTIGKEAFYGLYVSEIKMPNTVIAIGIDAFSCCTNLSSLELSTKLQSIPESAFNGCKKLTKVTIPATVASIGNMAFKSCYILNTVTFASGSTLETIGENAFRYNEKLTTISLPASVTSIGNFAFEGCTALTSFTIPTASKLSTIGEHSFENCAFTSITLPASLTTIGAGAFRSCDNLRTVSFRTGSKLKTIGNDAFYEDKNLTGISIPSTVETIGSKAFYKCNSITSITIPDSVTTIGAYAFNAMDKLTNVSIGKGVTSIGGNALVGSKVLKTITVNSANTAYVIYNGALYTKNYSTLIKYPPASTATSFKAHSKTKTVEAYAFSDTKNLITVDFSATSGMALSSSNFGTSCKSVTKLVIPSSENKAANGANVLKKYDSLFRNGTLMTLNDNPLVNNIGDTSKAPTFHSTIANAMYEVFEKYDDTKMMDQYLDAYVKFAVKDAYKRFGQSINSNADINNLSKLEKTYAIFKWVGDKRKYDSEDVKDPKNHVDASIFLHREYDSTDKKYYFYSVCDGFARAYNLIMNAAGLECYYIDNNLNHAFNCVKIGSHYYIADPTNNIFFKDSSHYINDFDEFSTPDKWRIYSKKNGASYKRHTDPKTTIDLVTELKYQFCDLNNDSYADNEDHALLQFYLVKQTTLTAAQNKMADINGDDSINYKDAAALRWYAETYKGNSKTYYRMGDLDCNGKVEQKDYDLLNDYIYYGTGFTMRQRELADLNNDGKITSADLTKLGALKKYKLGDVNRDGKVNKADKTLLLKYLARTATLSDDVLWYADYNGDGSIDVADAVRMSVDYNIPD